jgi:hypothetical protein
VAGGMPLQALLFLRGCNMEFVSHPIESGEMPRPHIIVQEIDMVFFTQLDAIYYLMSDENLTHSDALVEQLMFILRAQWKNWQDDFYRHVRKAETINERKMRMWVEQNKDFICELADLEENGADVVALFHKIIKKQGAESADNGCSHVSVQ